MHRHTSITSIERTHPRGACRLCITCADMCSWQDARATPPHIHASAAKSLNGMTMSACCLVQTQALYDFMYKRTVSLEASLQEQSDAAIRAAASRGWLTRLFSS
jgi:hypothetical protein